EGVADVLVGDVEAATELQVVDDLVGVLAGRPRADARVGVEGAPLVVARPVRSDPQVTTGGGTARGTGVQVQVRVAAGDGGLLPAPLRPAPPAPQLVPTVGVRVRLAGLER